MARPAAGTGRATCVKPNRREEKCSLSAQPILCRVMAKPTSSPGNLKTTNSADLPAWRAVELELFNNLKTANPLGLTIAPPLLGRSDEAIE
jgi:hypothetical protein